MSHEMTHALREPVRERIASNAAINFGANTLVQVLGLGLVGQVLTGCGAQLSLQFSRSDESGSDVVGMELGARA